MSEQLHITSLPRIIHENITIRLGDTVNPSTRWLLFIYATKVKGIRYKQLGITPAMGNMIKNRRRGVSNELLERILSMLTAKDLIDLAIAYHEWENGARRLAWLGRRPHTAEVRGSSPRGPTKPILTELLLRYFCGLRLICHRDSLWLREPRLFGS